MESIQIVLLERAELVTLCYFGERSDNYHEFDIEKRLWRLLIVI